MKLAAVVEFPRNITIYLVIVIVTDAGGGNCVFVAIFIIRSLCVGRLRGALGLRVIGCRVWCNGILVRLILGIAAILLFGIPVVGVFYISRLT